jgi:hypothetical protein
MSQPVSPIVQWLRQIWPRKAGLDAVIADYQTVGTLKHFLTDLALRGFVWTVHPRPPEGLFEAGLREGRRELALEVIRTAGERPENLYRWIERAAGATE